MKAPELDIFDKLVITYLARNEERAKRILKAAFPKGHFAKNPTRKPKEQIRLIAGEV